MSTPPSTYARRPLVPVSTSIICILSFMPSKLFRVREWLADRVPWIQYPRRSHTVYERRWPRYQDLTGKQRAWVWFAVFWGLVICLSIYGNLI
jgi:hypothetical protein